MLRREEELTNNFLKLQGAIELVFAGATAGDQNKNTLITTASEQNHQEQVNELLPSEGSRQNMVISVN